MLRGHAEDAWIHTSHLIVTFANAFRDPNSKPLKFEDVYPFAKKSTPAADPAELTEEQQQFEREMQRIELKKLVKESEGARR